MTALILPPVPHCCLNLPAVALQYRQNKSQKKTSQIARILKPFAILLAHVTHVLNCTFSCSFSTLPTEAMPDLLSLYLPRIAFVHNSRNLHSLVPCFLSSVGIQYDNSICCWIYPFPSLLKTTLKHITFLQRVILGQSALLFQACCTTSFTDSLSRVPKRTSSFVLASMIE